MNGTFQSCPGIFSATSIYNKNLSGNYQVFDHILSDILMIWRMLLSGSRTSFPGPLQYVQIFTGTGARTGTGPDNDASDIRDKNHS
jgi:hypothetical protein